VCLHVRARAHCLHLTTPPSASAPAPPPPPHIIVGIDACRTQCGGCAVCCEGRLAERARGEPTGSNQLQACAWRSAEHRASRPSYARHCHKNAKTNTPATKSHSRCAGRGAARLLGAGDTVPECTVCQAVTTGRVPTKYSFQPKMPYAPAPRFHINLTVSETAVLLAQFGHLFPAVL